MFLSVPFSYKLCDTTIFDLLSATPSCDGRGQPPAGNNSMNTRVGIWPNFIRPNPPFSHLQRSVFRALEKFFVTRRTLPPHPTAPLTKHMSRGI